MIVGYCRTSTADQAAGFEAQIRDLKAAGCEKLFSEQVSSAKARAELDRCLEFAREGDVLVCTKLDRLARSLPNLIEIRNLLERKNVALVILSVGGQPIDTRTPTGKLMLSIMGAIAEFERELTLERMREGVARAKREGRYRGRKPTARAKTKEILKLAKDGCPRAEIARKLRIGIASVYRILAENKAQGRAEMLITAKATAA